MSETTVMQKIQSVVRDIVSFNEEDVTLDDWSLRDTNRSPFMVIYTSDSFRARKDTRSATTEWEIPALLSVRFTTWPETYGEFRLQRQRVIDEFDKDAGQRTDDGVDIQEIRDAGPIVPFYDPYLTADERSDAMPLALEQLLIFEVKEF